mmetsp:Transcript_28437/g.53762  ORF Transcript_28437/g.53762 Transcript_28437/m.53762 type:complete len:284 (-) Transcript_28437:102-953(-)
MPPEALAQIVQETSIQRGLAAAVHRLARVVQHTEQARRLSALYQLADDLVVEERDRSPGDAFRLVLVLLSLECQRDENLLELLVDVVDAELFESVDVKNLEPVNVQDTQTQHVLGADQVFPDLLGDFLDVEADVDTLNEKVKEALKESLPHRVPPTSGLNGVLRHRVRLDLSPRSHRLELPRGESLADSLRVQVQQPTEVLQARLGTGVDAAPFRVVNLFRRKLDVAQVKDSGHDAEDGVPALVSDANRLHGVVRDLEFFPVVNVVNLETTALLQVKVRRWLL